MTETPGRSPSPGKPPGRAAERAEGTASDDPFALLGLPTRPGLSDDDVQAAWRRIAAATHPDREDGGDPARFGAAAAAYVVLRTGFGRGEALADLGLTATADPGGRHAHHRATAAASARGGRHRARRLRPPAMRPPRLTWQGRRPGGLAVRVAGAAAVGVVAVVISGWSPGVVGVLSGVLVWLLDTARHAFTGRSGRRAADE